MTTRVKQIFYVLASSLLLYAPVFVQAVSSRSRDCDETLDDLTIDCNKAVPTPLNTAFVGLAGASTFGSLVLAVIQIFLFIVATISVLFLIIGGFRYVTAHGNEEQAEGAKKTIVHSIIGLAIVLLSFAIIAIITNILVAGQL